MCLPHTIERLHHSVDDLAVSNEKLVSMQQTLKQTEKLAHMGQLSAGIAHELNNPLGVVIMYSNILLEECKEGSQLYNDLRLVAQQAERCKKIVGGLLNFARKNQVNNSMVDIHELIDQSLNAVIIPPSVKLVRKSDVADSLVELDAEQMIQVVSNLIKNAVEAMPEGGQLTIGPEETKQEISILISDTGTGISQEDLDKIFEPFFTTKTIGKGTGLGLATAYGIVKMHKGKITVTSNNDRGKGPTGTTFKISLPKNRKH
jgi:signal transduction histidine kinase